MEAFRRLMTYGLAPRTASHVIVRAYPGGGLTKDMQYLHGLRDLLSYLASGGEMSVLFVGKVGLSHLEIVRQLGTRGILKPAAVVPQYMRSEAAIERLEACRTLTVLELIVESEP